MGKLSGIKKKLKTNKIARIAIEKRKKIIYQLNAKKYDDVEFVTKLYKKFVGRDLNIDTPVFFTEKLQWLKLYYRDDRIPKCSDKYEAKKYLAEQGYSDLLIPTIGCYESSDEVDFDSLPERFIIKATHGSGWNFICRDKKSFNWNASKRVMDTWLTENLYIYGREWNYKEQTPRLIVEPLIDTKPLVDYKFMCFNGKCKAMQVNHDADDVHYVDFYDENWVLIPDMNSGRADNYGMQIPKPEQFEEMKEIAEKLAEPFPFVRVDLYNVEGKIYFGEMTFFPGSGFWKITPEKYDKMFGDYLSINK